jgi:hypothetical protein
MMLLLKTDGSQIAQLSIQPLSIQPLSIQPLAIIEHLHVLEQYVLDLRENSDDTASFSEASRNHQ